jgi:hypothetical protein
MNNERRNSTLNASDSMFNLQLSWRQHSKKLAAGGDT